MQTDYFEPTFLNLEYVFYHITQFLLKIWEFIQYVFTSDAIGTFIRIVFTLLIIALACFVIYTMYRIKQVEATETAKLDDIQVPKKDKAIKNERWEKVKSHIESNNPAEWKVAIFEADTILEEMTMKMRLSGDTLGERLKNAEPSDFQTLQNAWAAHKIRNNIAHQGSTFELTHKDAHEAIKNFETVFQEFDYI